MSGSRFEGLAKEERRDCRAFLRWRKEQQRKAAKRKGTKA